MNLQQQPKFLVTIGRGHSVEWPLREGLLYCSDVVLFQGGLNPEVVAKRGSTGYTG